MYLDDNGNDIPYDPYASEWTYRTPPGGLAPVPVQPSPEDAALLQQMAAQYNINPGETDAANLALKNPEDRDQFLRDLNAQFQLRAASNGGPREEEQGYSFAPQQVAAPAQSAPQNIPIGPAPQSIQPYQPFSFDPSQVGQSDAFKFRFDKAMQAIQRSGAAKGTLLTNQTLAALQREASGLASQEYDAEYGRQANTYDLNRGTHQFNEQGRYDSQRANRLDDYSFMDTDRTFNRGVYEDDRNFGRGVLESDRAFNRGVLESDRGFNRGVLESDRNFDYVKDRDKMDDYWRFIDYGYGSQRGGAY